MKKALFSCIMPVKTKGNILVLGWNIINFVEGEGKWLMTLFAILTLAAASVHGVLWLKTRLKSENALFSLCIDTLEYPLIVLIWTIALSFSLDLITDRFFSHSYKGAFLLIFKTLLLFLAAWFLFSLKSRLTSFYMKKEETSKEAVYALSKCLSILLFVLFSLLLLETFNVNIQALLAFGGIGGIAIAFSSQDCIANFFGGLIIHGTKMFTLGDEIALSTNSLTGIVESIGWYQTTIRTKSKHPIYIPNANFIKAYVTNYSRRTARKIEERIALRLEDIDKIPKIIDAIEKSLQENPLISQKNIIGISVQEITPISSVLFIEALTEKTQFQEFLKVKNGVILDIIAIIQNEKAQLATPVQTIFTHSVD